MKIKNKIKINLLSLAVSLTFLYLFTFVNFTEGATPYTLLEALPGIGDGNGVVTDGFGSYIAQMFILSLQLATVLAVFMISLGGFKYITSESFTGTSDAKKTITNAVIGLFILLTSWLLLYTLNPDLVQNKFVIPSVNTIGGLESVIPNEMVETSSH
ncbi:pilin [Patescibacteria group bacterium]|nr:pilin [Patescibacteria group bacterium]